MRLNAPWMLRIPAAVEARRVKQYEGWIVRQFDHTLAVTEPDRRALVDALQSTALNGGINPKSRPIHVIPIAVDTQALHRRKRDEKLSARTLHYPDADGIRGYKEFPARADRAGCARPDGKSRDLHVRPDGRTNPASANLDPYMDQRAWWCVRPGGCGVRSEFCPCHAGGHDGGGAEHSRSRCLVADARGLAATGRLRAIRSAARWRRRRLAKK